MSKESGVPFLLARPHGLTGAPFQTFLCRVSAAVAVDRVGMGKAKRAALDPVTGDDALGDDALVALLAAGLRLDDAQTVLRTYSAGLVDLAARWFGERRDALVAQLVSDGVAADAVTVRPMADCRYLGQGYELPVELPGVTAADLEQLPALFHALHHERYGHFSPGEEVEVVTLRLAAVGGVAAIVELPRAGGGRAPDPAALLAERQITVPGGTEATVPVWDRERLVPGNVVDGPALIHQMDATTLVLDRQRATVLSSGDLRVEELS